MTRKAGSAGKGGTGAKVLKWVGGATAVLSLAFGVRQAIGYASGWRGRQRRVAELLAVDSLQRASGDYRGAWTSLAQAAALGNRGDAVRTAREDLAMVWLEDARSSVGMSLGEIGDTLTTTISRGALAATGARRGDLLAHLGWAYFLRWRDGQRQLDPAAQYRQALAADPGNPYAHAMLGHWALWWRDAAGGGPGAYAEANRHFAAALARARDPSRSFVRTLQLAALQNSDGPEADLEMLTVAADMLASGDSITPDDRDKLWQVYYDAFIRSSTRFTMAQMYAAVKPADLLRTYRWLFDNTGYVEAKATLYTYSLARLQEAAGDTADALATYRAARKALSRGYDDYRFRIDSGIARLTRRR